MNKLTHINKKGEAHMVDVGAKPATEREAVAEGVIRMQPETLELILKGGHKKGDVLAVARVAGIMAAKKTAELIPLCHPIPVTAIEVELTPHGDMPMPQARDARRRRPGKAESAVHARARVCTQAQTGVEMEALMAVEIALLTIYDMCKAVDRGMVLTDIRLVSKSGGRSGAWIREKS